MGCEGLAVGKLPCHFIQALWVSYAFTTCDATRGCRCKTALQTFAENHSIGSDETAFMDEACHNISECYCTRGTACGWCSTTGKAMLAGNGGTPWKGYCGKWILYAKDCDNLNCGNLHFEKIFDLTWFPGLALMVWLMTSCWREALRPPQNTNSEVDWLHPIDQEFLSHVRCFEAFKKGLDSTAQERLPEGSKMPYQRTINHFSALRRSGIFSRHLFFDTLVVSVKWRVAFGASLRSATLLTFLSSLYLTLLRCSAIYLSWDEYQQVAMVSEEIEALVACLHTAVSLLLSFYVLQRLGWFWAVMQEGFRVQGRANDLGMLAGTRPRATEEDWHALYRLYRHLMVAFFLAFRDCTPQLQKIKLRGLVDAGLLTAEEEGLLNKSLYAASSVLESWLADWVEQFLHGEAKHQAFGALREYRSALASIGEWIDIRAPVGFETLLYVVVYTLVLVLPFGPSHIKYKDREAISETAHVVPVVAVSLLSSFYLALLHLLRHLQHPFSQEQLPCDSLNPVQIMNETERKLRDYLTAARPGIPRMSPN